MTPLSAEYRHDRESIIARLGASACPENRPHGQIPVARTLAAALRAFLQKWRAGPEAAADAGFISALRGDMLALERMIEERYLLDLKILLQCRHLCLVSRQAVEAGNRMNDKLRDAPEEERREFIERSWKNLEGQPPCPREGVEACAAGSRAAESTFLELTDGFETDWPDRLRDPLYVRILVADSAACPVLETDLRTRCVAAGLGTGGDN